MVRPSCTKPMTSPNSSHQGTNIFNCMRTKFSTFFAISETYFLHDWRSLQKSSRLANFFDFVIDDLSKKFFVIVKISDRFEWLASAVDNSYDSRLFTIENSCERFGIEIFQSSISKNIWQFGQKSLDFEARFFKNQKKIHFLSKIFPSSPNLRRAPKTFFRHCSTILPSETP